MAIIPKIETQRLILREIVREDIPDMQEMAFFNPKDNTAPDPALHLFERNKEQTTSGQSISWGITIKPDDRIIGNCGYFRGFDNNIGEIGYFLNAAFRGQGIAKEAVSAIIEYGFKSLNLQTICAYTGPDNLPSQKLLRSLGFTLDDPMPDEDGYLRFWVERG